jgi:non-ribosomal peptide synthetase component E (peptide arylation enzyme)
MTSQRYLLDEQLNEVPKGEIGHLFLGGPGVMLGYLFRAV